MPSDFPTTRAILERLDHWLATLAAPLLPLKRVDEPDGHHRWEFRDETPEALQVGKAVRMISGIRAALALADDGYTTESGGLLRMVSDFAQEIVSVGEGLLEGRLTSVQKKFVKQYFAPIARNADEHARIEHERYVTREELFAAHQRLADKTTKRADDLRKLTRFLNYGYDKYVHGAYQTAMELFRGDQQRFMLRGHDSARHRCIAKTSVAGKLHEVLIALEFMAMTRQLDPLIAEIRSNRHELERSSEQSGQLCRGLR